MPRMTLRAYARHRGCALSTVQAAISRGRIKQGRDGLIEQEAADRSWALRTEQNRKQRPGPSPNGDPKKRAGREARGDVLDEQFWKAKTARETYAARLAELEFQRRAGMSLPIEEFERAGYAAGRRVHDALVNLGDRLGPVVAGLAPADAIKLINDECARILDELSAPSPNGKHSK